MSIPRATVRLQLHRHFPFDAAVEVVPYLAKLGISHIYASPILAAQPGSTHGYDTIDPSVVNPELGGRQLMDALGNRVPVQRLPREDAQHQHHEGPGRESSFPRHSLPMPTR